jgi:hypothetical protein
VVVGCRALVGLAISERERDDARAWDAHACMARPPPTHVLD